MLESLDDKIELTIKDSKTFKKIMSKKEEFLTKKLEGLEEKFSELTFCTLTANTSAEMGLRCQERLFTLSEVREEKIRKILVSCGYRFPNTRSKFVCHNYMIRDKLESILEMDDRRTLLVDTFMGIGMKEASHFLRNIGYFQYSILDKHVQKFLSSYYGREIKIKSRKDYENVEPFFLELSDRYNLEPGIMDLVVWYIMTGKILK